MECWGEGGGMCDGCNRLTSHSGGRVSTPNHFKHYKLG